jgi:hypothetical protein
MPSLVDKNPIEADEGGRGSAVRPGELAVPEGELKKRKVVDGVIEEVSVRRREIGIVPIRQVTGKVKITSDEPRSVITGIVGPKTVKEDDFPRTVTGRVDIGDPEREPVACEGQVNGEGMSRSDRAQDGEEVRVPGRDKTAGSPNRVDVVEGSQREREEGAGLSRF